MPRLASCIRALVFCNLVALPAIAQHDSWTEEIDNRLVRVSRGQLAPRETVSAAELPPALVVFLTDYSVRVTGTGPQQELGGKPGEVLWHSGGRISFENLSDQRLEVAQVVPTFGSEPSYPLPAANPRNVNFENDLIRVRRLRLPAGFRADERRGRALVFQLAPAHIKFTYADGRVEELRMNAGEIRFEVGGAFTFENLGDRLEVLRIDLKTSKQDRD